MRREPRVPVAGAIAADAAGSDAGVVTPLHAAAAPGIDRLTGLADRDTFMRELDGHVRRARRRAHPLALLLVNVDRFRAIQETLGAETGDRLLAEVAARIRRGAPRTLVARISGDEFAVILPHVRTSGDAVAVATALLATMNEPCPTGTAEIHLGISLGIALFPHDADESSTLLRRAAMALSRAKGDGGGCHSLFHASLGERARDRMMLEQELHGAITRREIRVHYQPLVDAATRRVVAVEALARWHHPLLGDVPPSRFIPVAEETGMVRALGLHVLRTALHDAGRWRTSGLPVVRVAVNVSARQLAHAGFLSDVAEIVAASGLPAETLELEVTESAVMADIELAAATLRELAARGIAISLDDFGTGYSCLAQLNHLAVSTVKIDRSFLHASPLVADPTALVRALVSLARSLDLRVVAEGVETVEQLERLELEGCDVYQGFFFSEALPADALHALLARRQLRAGAG